MNKIVLEDMKNVADSLGNLVSNFEGANILITGYQGFLGSNFSAFYHFLNNEILKQKAEITCIDNKIVDLEDQTSEFTKDFNIIYGDVVKDLPDTKFDYIIHCAGIASPPFYRKYPLETIYVNAISYWDMLNKINLKNIKGILYFSTSEIYGDPDINHIPTEEGYRGNVSCTGPRSCYDESERLGETISLCFAKQRDIPIKIARPFNIYGPFMRLDDKRVIPDFAKFALKNKAIKIFSDGSPTRAFCYISDALEGFFRTLLLGGEGCSYNIGNDAEEISMLKLAQLVSSVVDDVKIEFSANSEENYLTDNPQRRCPNINKAKKELSYYPKVSMKDGLARIVNWYKKIYFPNES